MYLDGENFKPIKIDSIYARTCVQIYTLIIIFVIRIFISSSLMMNL